MFRYVPYFTNDAFFDDFFQPRRAPVKTIEGGAAANSNSNSEVVPANSQGGWLDRWYNFDDFKELEDVLKLKELPDKYLVQVKDATASKKDLQVNYHKKENLLEVTISHHYEKKDGDSRSYTSSSTSTSSVSFQKPVKPDEISAEVGAEGVIITVPKAAADPENVVSIDVKRNEKPLDGESA